MGISIDSMQVGQSINWPAMSAGASSDRLHEGQLNLMSAMSHSFSGNDPFDRIIIKLIRTRFGILVFCPYDEAQNPLDYERSEVTAFKFYHFVLNCAPRFQRNYKSACGKSKKKSAPSCQKGGGLFGGTFMSYQQC